MMSRGNLSGHVVALIRFSKIVWLLIGILHNHPTDAFSVRAPQLVPRTIPMYHHPQQLPKRIMFRCLTIRERQKARGSRSSTQLGAFLSASSNDSWKEKWLEKLPSSSVVKAIEQQQKQESTRGKVTWTASDVAALAGISLSQANRELTALASLTQGDIAVTTNGDLLYTFPDNIGQVLSQNSAKYKALQTWQTAVWPRLFWLTRVTFGVTLLVSLLAIFSTIVFAGSYANSSSSDNDKDNGRRESGGGGGMRMGGGWNFFWGPSPLDFFYYRPYYGSYYNQRQEPRDPEDMGFLESIFSYVFGDGDPNAGLEEKRLRLAAQMIRNSNGAVTAEQLAPFCDEVPTPTQSQESTLVDESFVLPIVTQLNGEPQVTDDCNIIYVFPELQQSNSATATLSTAAASSSSSSSSLTLARQKKEARILRRAGLRPDASPFDIQQLLRFNGISTRGALDRSDLIQIVEQALPNEKDDEEDLEDPSMLKEQEFKFSLASDLNKFLAGGLGIINLLGALYLGGRLAPLAAAAASMYQVPAWVGLVQTAFPWLLTYAVLFNAVPLFRAWYIGQQNEEIRKRNEVRRLWKAVLNDSSNRELQAKLKAAQAARKRLEQQQNKDRLGASKEIVFDTSQPMEDRDKLRQREALKEFDNLLGQRQQQENEDNTTSEFE